MSSWGIPGHSPIIIALIGAVLAVYATGWFFEDTAYWLARTAIIVWAFALPLILLLLGITWRIRTFGWLYGLAFAVPIFLIHLGIMGLIDGRVQDDHVGIAAMFAGAAFAGWLIGRALHTIIVLRRKTLQQIPMELP